MNFSDRNAGRLLTLLISRHRSRARPLWRRKQGERWRFRTFNAGIRQQDPYPQTRVRTWVRAWLRTRVRTWFGHGCEHEFKSRHCRKTSRSFVRLCSRLQRRIPTVIAVVLLLAVWEAWVRIGNVPSTMIAAPSEIAQATVETWSTLWPATQVTLLEGTVGFLFAVLFGILIGILLYCSCIANAALFPLLSAAQTMPLISIAPLFLIWFGFEISGKS